MIASVYNSSGSTLLRQEVRKPVCGEDFCDACGDCLVCYGGEACYGTDPPGVHFFVIYEDEQ